MGSESTLNFRRITRELNVPKDKSFEFDDIIIWEAPNGKTIDKNNPSIFGWWEVNDLLAFKEFCKDASLATAEFAERWKGRGYERGESQPFWIDLLSNVFGIETPSDGFIKAMVTGV